MLAMGRHKKSVYFTVRLTIRVDPLAVDALMMHLASLDSAASHRTAENTQIYMSAGLDESIHPSIEYI